MKFDKEGRELPDPTPVEIPANARRPEGLHSMIARMIRTRVSDVAASEGYETFEESNDFEVADEEPDMTLTKYEQVEMAAEELRESGALKEKYEKEVKAERERAAEEQRWSEREARLRKKGGSVEPPAGDGPGMVDEDV